MRLVASAKLRSGVSAAAHAQIRLAHAALPPMMSSSQIIVAAVQMLQHALLGADVLLSWVRYSWLKTEKAEMPPALGGCAASAGVLAALGGTGFWVFAGMAPANSSAAACA